MTVLKNKKTLSWKSMGSIQYSLIMENLGTLFFGFLKRVVFSSLVVLQSILQPIKRGWGKVSSGGVFRKGGGGKAQRGLEIVLDVV